MARRRRLIGSFEFSSGQSLSEVAAEIARQQAEALRQETPESAEEEPDGEGAVSE